MRRMPTAKVATAGRPVAGLWILSSLVPVTPAVAQEPAAHPVAPEDEVRIRPWRASLPPSLPAPGAPEAPHPPAGYFFAPERMAELKRDALVRPDQPWGRIVPVAAAPDAAAESSAASTRRSPNAMGDSHGFTAL